MTESEKTPDDQIICREPTRAADVSSLRPGGQIRIKEASKSVLFPNGSFGIMFGALVDVSDVGALLEAAPDPEEPVLTFRSGAAGPRRLGTMEARVT